MTVSVRVPASTANLGPGYDCLGLALSIYSTFHFERSDALRIEGCPEAYRNDQNLVIQAFWETLRKAGAAPFPVHLVIDADVPVARGLGSSSTCIAAGAAAANAFLGGRFTKDDLFQICSNFEGHPDNAAPAVFGGLTASFAGEGKFHTVRFPIDPAWKFVAVIPNYEVRTSEARKAMPKTISVADSVFTTSHAIAMTAALVRGDEALLREACQDRLHEPCRMKLIPDYEAIRSLALEAEMTTFFISGSGSTLMAVTKDIAAADRFIALSHRDFPEFATHILHADLTGAQVL